MNRDKHKNIAMVTISAVVLLLANLGVWMAAQKGMIEPVANKVVWGGFVALNMASILWAVTLLGLQPMVVAVSYVAGGFLAFKGVQGMGGVSVAEVTTAGATYGAFGALAVGNATAKVRLAFYNKKQVPFLFIIIALLVFDAALNSGISSAGSNVILNAVVFPFVLAGVIVGLLWSILIRFGIGHNPGQTRRQAVKSHVVVETVPDAEAPQEDNMLKIQIPDDVVEEEEAAFTEAVMEPAAEPETAPVPAPAAQATVASAAVAEEKNEDFFPLEIDKDDEFVVPQEEYALNLEEEHHSELSMHSFDASLYESGIMHDTSDNMVAEDPASSVSLDLDEEPEAVHQQEVSETEPVAPQEIEEPAPAETQMVAESSPPEQQEERSESTPDETPEVAETAPVEPQVSTDPEPVEEKKTEVAEKEPDEPKQAGKPGDWLSGHLDLLSKLK